MSKKKKGKKNDKHETLERIVLATAILNLLKEILDLIHTAIK